LNEQIAAQDQQGRRRAGEARFYSGVSGVDGRSRRQDQSALVEVERTLQNARERLARLEAEKIALERWLSKDPVAAASGALRQASLPGIQGPVRSLFKTSGAYERLLERALGDREHFFIADTLNDAQSAIRHLSEERKGWATLPRFGPANAGGTFIAVE